MTPERWSKVKEVFAATQDLDTEAREAYLERLCRGDAALLKEVRSLLAAHDGSGAFDRLGEAVVAPLLGSLGTQLRTGRRVGPYLVRNEVGRGGMGVVYRAVDERLGRDVALKFLAPFFSLQADAKARFLQEARTVSTLDHPNICTVYDIGETEQGSLYFAMAYYRGETLIAKLGRGPLPVSEALHLVEQVAAGLERAHEAGIVHRDIKPGNLMVTDRGEVKILDFGVAKLDSGHDLTGAGQRPGTVAYMAPEQIRGEPVDARTDLWALGVVLYEALTGRHPFRDTQGVSVTSAILERDPTLPSVARPGLPVDVDAVIRRALARRPADRYRTAAAFRADVQALMTGTSRVASHEPVRLPASLTSFVGRDDELEGVHALLANARLITLTGPAGTGKTRLAIEAARAAAAAYPGGVYFVSLAPVTDPEEVPEAIVHALEVGEHSSMPVLKRLETEILDRRVLLVLDNFEQVVTAASFVAALLGACPGLSVLVTSRVALLIGGEHEYAVPPLALPAPAARVDAESLSRSAAVALFVERAQAVRPGFALTRDNAADVADICRRLDGMPLAIELAAARTKLFAPAALLARLEHRLDLLKSGDRDRPARHQTLRQAIAWSYELLAPEEQAFFRRLGVFSGGATLDEIEQVIAGDTVALDAIEGVETLLNQSLLRPQEGPGDEPRFLMLETIREYALEQLRRAGEEEAVRRAHAACFLALAEQAEAHLTGPMQGVWMDRLEADLANLRAALAWTLEHRAADMGLRLGVAMWRFWLSRGHLVEGRRYLEALLSLPTETAPVPLRARALNGLGTLVHNYGDNAEARARLEESLYLWRSERDKAGMAAVLNNLAWVACELSDLHVAYAFSREGLALNRELNDTRGIAVALNNLGWVAYYRGEFEEARTYHRDSLAQRRAHGDQRGIAFALTNLAMAERYLGAYDRADQRLDEALKILTPLRDTLLTGFARMVKGGVASDRGDLKRGRDLLQKSLNGWIEVGNRSGIAWVQSELGMTLLDLGEPDQAEPLLRESLSTWEAIGGVWGTAQALCGLGLVAGARGKIKDGLDLLQDSLKRRESVGDAHGLVVSLEAVARLHARAMRFEPAAVLLAAARRIRDTLGAPVPPRHTSVLEQTVAVLQEALGDTPYRAAVEAGYSLTLREAYDRGREPSGKTPAPR